MSVGPTTVEFGGDASLTLVGDEWNRGHGRGDQPTILMLHGGGQNRFSWKSTGQILADRGFHVIALDARGHGDSDRAPNAEYTVDAFARDVAAVPDSGFYRPRHRDCGGHQRGGEYSGGEV